jgi:phage gpG-like protein
MVGNDEVSRKLARLPDDVKQEVRGSIVRLALKIVAKIKAEKLSGQVLNVRTGTLRRSISHQIVDTPSALTATIGSNLKYARAHEYGFKGAVTVREHLRTIKQAFGKTLATPQAVLVSAHTRNMNLPERSFIRSALRDMEPEIIREISGAVSRGIRR